MATNKNIKGITIEIGGNTTKLQDALKKVNSVVQDSNAELKRLEQALKLDPKNTELLAQKQEVLKNNIKATTERLDQLKEAQRQMGNYSSLTEEQKEQYRYLSIEIAKSESALKGMNKQLSESSKIDMSKLNESLKKVGEVALDVSKKLAQVSAVVGGALAGLVTAGVKSYAELEQNIGGVETLFKDSSDKVIENAKKAFKTAGVSANEYMAGVTSFSASLLQSLGGDTSKAADVADMAFRDMSDNANKFGTDMASIQNAYQGFAKQNYTMLDNLKLGYGGTKTEMQRLLADAEKLTGVHYDISNLSDVYEAIHAIQKQMDISGYSTDQLKEKLKNISLTEEELKKVATDMGVSYEDALKKMNDGTLTVKDSQVLLGTTAKEAELTISGSVNSMKAAFDNFLNGSGTPESLSESLTNVFTNIGSAISSLAPSILSGIVTVFQNILPQVIQMITDLLPQLMTAISSLIDSLLNMVSSNTENIANTVTNLINQFVMFITNNLPKIIEIGLKLIISLAQGLAQSLPTLIPAIIECVNTIINVLIENLPLIIDTGIELLLALIEGLADAIPQLVEMLPTIIEKIITTLMDNLPEIIECGIKILNALIEGLIQCMPELILYVPKIIIAIVKALIEGLPKILEAGGSLIAGLIDGIGGKITAVKNAAQQIFDTIKNTLKDLPSKAIQWGKDMLQGLADGIKGAIGKVTSAVKGVADKIKNFLHFSRPDEGPLREYEKWMPDFMKGLAKGIDKSSYLVEDATKNLADKMANTLSVDNMVNDLDGALKGLNGKVATSVNPQINPNVTYESNYKMMAQAVREALEDMAVELDDDKVGRFIINKVSNEVYN